MLIPDARYLFFLRSSPSEMPPARFVNTNRIQVSRPVMHENRLRRIGESYLNARETIIRFGFSNEIDWQESRHLAQLSECDFLAQAAWTILAAGFRESVVRKLFPRISLAFLHWTNARAIARRRRICETAALRVFNHPVKIRAIGAFVLGSLRPGSLRFWR